MKDSGKKLKLIMGGIIASVGVVAAALIDIFAHDPNTATTIGLMAVLGGVLLAGVL